MINNVVLVGRLTKDPVIRTTQSGIPVASFTLAIDRDYKNANGERDADFINVIAFRKTAELCSQYLAKGIKTGVVGGIQARNYEKDGQRVYVTEVVVENLKLIESINNRNSNYQQYNNYQNPQQNSGYVPPQQNSAYKPPQQTKQSNNSYQAPQNNHLTRQPNPFANANSPIEISDDDLPF